MKKKKNEKKGKKKGKGKGKNEKGKKERVVQQWARGGVKCLESWRCLAGWFILVLFFLLFSSLFFSFYFLFFLARVA
jgi:hypothetical protein